MTKRAIAVGVSLVVLSGCSSSVASAATLPAITQSIEQIKPYSLTKATLLTTQYAKMQKVVKSLKRTVKKTGYVFSGDSPRGWDCSGLVVWTYKHFGLTLPHSANKQGHLHHKVKKPMVGDVVVFSRDGGYHFYHSAIYVGKGMVLNANSVIGTTVIQPLTDYKGDTIVYQRLIHRANPAATVIPASLRSAK